MFVSQLIAIGPIVAKSSRVKSSWEQIQVSEEPLVSAKLLQGEGPDFPGSIGAFQKRDS
jgi:hypothetical protein